MKTKNVKMDRFKSISDLLDSKAYHTSIDLKKKEILFNPTTYGSYSASKLRNELNSLESMGIPFKKSLVFDKHQLRHLVCSSTYGLENIENFKANVLGKIDSYVSTYDYKTHTNSHSTLTLEFLEGLVFDWKEEKRWKNLTRKILNTGKIPKYRPFKNKHNPRTVGSYEVSNILDLPIEILEKFFVANVRYPTTLPDSVKTSLQAETFKALGFNLNHCPRYQALTTLSVFNDLGDEKTA